jgi:hypothetical protein
LLQRLGAVVTGGLLLAQSGQAVAQELVAPELTTFEREDEPGVDGPIAVRLRPQPAFDAIGIPLGMFRLYPRLDLGPVLDSNLLVTPTNQEFALGFTVEPSANLTTEWSGGDFNTYAGSRIRIFPGNDTENTGAYWAGARTRLDIRHDVQLRLAAEAGSFAEDRISNFSPIDTLEPVQFDRVIGSATLDVTLGRLRLLAGADADRLVFHDGLSRSSPGTVIDQSGRTRTRLQGQVRVAYDFSPAAAVFGGLTYNQRDYDVTPIVDVNGTFIPLGRDSQGGAVVGGVRIELDRLIELRVATGMLWQNYQAPLRDVSGLYASADVIWYPTSLTTVVGALRREVAESGSIVSSGTLRTAAEVRVDHELRRNIILSAEAEQDHFDFSGLDRSDRRVSVNFSSRYRPNRWLEFNASGRYINQESSGAQATVDFDVVRLLLAATLRY